MSRVPAVIAVEPNPDLSHSAGNVLEYEVAIKPRRPGTFGEHQMVPVVLSGIRYGPAGDGTGVDLNRVN